MKTMKRMIALVLAIVLCAGCFAACNSEKPNETTNKPSETTNQPSETTNQPTETTAPTEPQMSGEEANYKKLTFSDFKDKEGAVLGATGKICDEPAVSGTKGKYYDAEGTGIDGILFEGKFNFPSTGGESRFGVFYIGSKEFKQGIIIMQDAKRNLVVGRRFAGNENINIAVTGENLLDNPDLKIGVSFKYENYDAASGMTDLKVGIFVNNELISNGYITVTNVDTAPLCPKIQLFDDNIENSVAVSSVN